MFQNYIYYENMMSYSADEYIDMIITYGACGGNGYAAGRLYAERFPERKHHPSNRVIQNCIQRLRETGSVFITRSLSYGVQMRFCTEEKILQAYENSGKSVRHIARSFGVSRNSVYRILDRNGVRLCGIQRLTRDEKQDDTCEGIFIIFIKCSLLRGPARFWSKKLTFVTFFQITIKEYFSENLNDILKIIGVVAV